MHFLWMNALADQFVSASLESATNTIEKVLEGVLASTMGN